MGSDFYDAWILPHAGIIIKICRAYTNSQDDFEDYYQEVCLQIWRSRERFQQQCSWSTWIYKISLNVCLTYLKKHNNSPVTFTSDPLPEQLVKDSRGLPDESIGSLYLAIHQLSEIDRAIILLYLEQQSNKDIAQIIGVTANNIGVRIARIKQKLNQILNLEEHEHD
jgi:RNA polymerase sigma-70 factor (ECF subfamily)